MSLDMHRLTAMDAKRWTICSSDNLDCRWWVCLKPQLPYARGQHLCQTVHVQPSCRRKQQVTDSIKGPVDATCRLQVLTTVAQQVAWGARSTQPGWPASPQRGLQALDRLMTFAVERVVLRNTVWGG